MSVWSEGHEVSVRPLAASTWAFNREMIVLFWRNRGCEQRTRTENREALPTIPRDAGSAWFLAEPVSAAVTNAGDCPFPLASN